MSDQIKTITDKTAFEKIINNFFKNNNVFLRTKHENIKIQFFGYSENTVAFKIPFIKNIAGNCIIFTRHANNTINALVSFFDKQEDDIFLFILNKIQIIYQSREEDRKSLHIGNDKDKSIVFITNLISYSIIQNSLSLESKKIERIRESILNEMSQAFNFIKIFFCNDGKRDIRMNYFFRKKEPIFISQINDKESKENKDKINFYINNIYSKDYYLQSRKELISEISIPLLYKTKLPYGYIQVNNTGLITNSMLLIVKKFAALIDELMSREKVFPKSEDKLIVSNISKKGLGVVFKERKYIRYFKENNYIYFDLLLPDNKVAAIMAMVRNITLMDNKIIMVGCSIEEIDALSEVNYEEFVDSFQTPDKEANKIENEV